VFQAQSWKKSMPTSDTMMVTEYSDEGEVEIEITREEYDKDFLIVSFEREVKKYQQEAAYLLQFPFEKYFANDIELARVDLLTAWLLDYYDEQFSRILIPYSLEFKNVKNAIKQKNIKDSLSRDLSKDMRFIDFQQELRKLSTTTRLHFFNVFEYSGFGKKKMKNISNMTNYKTTRAGIDANESSDILRQSKLIVNFPNGTCCISPEYVDVISFAFDYANKMTPMYYEWKENVQAAIHRKLYSYVYGKEEDGSDDRYVDEKGLLDWGKSVRESS